VDPAAQAVGRLRLRAEVAGEDPSVPNGKLLLHLDPLLPRSCDKPWLPENFIYFGHRQPRNIA
jgi:hypothetical protein